MFTKVDYVHSKGTENYKVDIDFSINKTNFFINVVIHCNQKLHPKGNLIPTIRGNTNENSILSKIKEDEERQLDLDHRAI